MYNNKAKKKVVVAMSGGVDSSVTAALLMEQGYEVSGITLKLWKSDFPSGSKNEILEKSEELAKKVADQLSIPFQVLDAVDRFRSSVVDKFINDYRFGRTPNPCFTCNQTIKWGMLLDEALLFGADYLATGHYARIVHQQGGDSLLLKGSDSRKDQSYVLAGLTQEQLSHALLPLGEMSKPEVRKLAKHYGLSVADRDDSQDICFLGGEDYRSFLSRVSSIKSKPGNIIDQHGKVIGEHQGLENYTIGQRKGLGSGLGMPYYVISIDVNHNTLIVGTVDELGATIIHAGDVNWISGYPGNEQKLYQVKIRYKANPVPCKISSIKEDKLDISLYSPVRDATPGQIAVIYDDDVVIGSGVIFSTERG